MSPARHLARPTTGPPRRRAPSSLARELVRRATGGRVSLFAELDALSFGELAVRFDGPPIDQLVEASAVLFYQEVAVRLRQQDADLAAAFLTSRTDTTETDPDRLAGALFGLSHRGLSDRTRHARACAQPSSTARSISPSSSRSWTASRSRRPIVPLSQGVARRSRRRAADLGLHPFGSRSPAQSMKRNSGLIRRTFLARAKGTWSALPQGRLR